MSLKKEMVFAISLGLLLGGVAALLIAQVPQKLLGFSGNDTDVEEQPTPTPYFEQSLALEVLVPAHQAFVEEDKVTVSGKTNPDVLVAVTSPIDENVVYASNEGGFSAEVALSDGANEIVVVALNGDEEIQKTIVVNYGTLENTLEEE